MCIYSMLFSGLNCVGYICLSSAGMPEEALPQGPRKGKLSYTIVSTATNAKIEVLLKGKAFRIVKVGELQGDLFHLSFL